MLLVLRTVGWRDRSGVFVKMLRSCRVEALSLIIINYLMICTRSVT